MVDKVVTNTLEQHEENEAKVYTVVLKRPNSSDKYVHWTADVVDNEHLGKKSSKICCVYHKPRQFDESDSEESDWEPDRAEYPWYPDSKSSKNKPSEQKKTS